LVLLGLEIFGLGLDVGVEDAYEVRHCGRGALEVADAVGALELRVIHLFFELLWVDVVYQCLVLEYQELVHALLHLIIISHSQTES